MRVAYQRLAGSGAVAGIIAIGVRVVSELILSAAGLFSGFPSFPYYRYVTVLVLPPKPGPGFVSLIAFVISIVASASFFGMLLAYVLVRTGGDYWFLKGLGYGTVTFVNHTALIPKVWEPRLQQVLEEPWVIPWEIVMHLTWGLLAAYLISRLIPNMLEESR